MKKIKFFFLIFTVSTLLFATDLSKFWYEVAISTDDPILKEIYLLRSLKEDPDYIEAYKALGVFYYIHGKLDRAQKYLEFLPQQKITLPEERVIKIVKPEEEPKEKAHPPVEIRAFEQEILEKLEFIGKNLQKIDDRLFSGEDIIPIRQPEPIPAPAPEKDDEFEKKFLAFANNVESLLTSQTNQIDRLNKNHQETIDSIENQSKNIQNIYDMSKLNQDNIKSIEQRLDEMQKEIEELRETPPASQPEISLAPAPVPVPTPTPVKPEASPQPAPSPQVKEPVSSYPPEPKPVKPAPTEVRIINVNTGSQNDFAQIPGLENIDAILIVRYRERNGQFNSIEDFKSIPGMDKKYEQIKKYLYFDEPQAAVVSPAQVSAPAPKVIEPAVVAPSPPEKVNINNATPDQLSELEDISRLDSVLITRYRERYGLYESVEDLLKVPGITEDKLEAIREHITIE